MADEQNPREGGGPPKVPREDSPTIASPPRAAPDSPSSRLPSRFSFPADGTPFASEAFKNWDRYEVGALLGEGGMGQVYKAFDPRLKRTLALKVLKVQDDEILRRFINEAQTQARVDHPNVCRVYEVGDVAGHPYIAMQYVEGQTLDAAAADLSLEQRVLLMKQVSEAVHAAHQLGLIHRDIKPSNILVEQAEGQGPVPYVTDFGLARETTAPHLTQTGTITGTPQYMSPEQARGGAMLDRRTDVYSLGATLYELLSGRPPFTGDSAVDVLLHVVEWDPPRLRQAVPSVPQDLETIVLKCLDKDVSRRYESARALAEDLQRFLSGDPIQARPASFSYRLIKKVRKNKGLTAVVAVSLVAILGLGGLWGVTRARSAERARLAQRFGQETERAAAALRYAYMMPLHDTRPELRRAEETLRRIDVEAAGIGGSAQAAGDYAVGRALVALRKPREARARLEKAWKAGYQEPEAAYALGQALGMIYQEEVEQANRVSNPEMRDARIAAINREFLQPGLAYLRQSEGVSLDAPAYAQGLIALYDEDYTRAIECAHEAERQVPWLYEGWLLAGDALCRRAQASQHRGEYEKAAADLNASGLEYERAAALARSAPEVYVSQATRWVTALELAVSQGKPAEEELRRVLDASARALEADPDNADALNRQARAYWRLSEHYQRTGGDPMPPLREAMAASERILKIHPEDAQAHFHMGSALNRLAEVQVARGEDPEPNYGGAIEHLTKSLEIEPAHPFTLNNLGLAYWRRGQYQMTLGKDPTQDLDRAAEYFQRASSVLLAPVLSLNRGNVYATKSIYEQEHGKDPTASLEQAVLAYEAALSLNPKEAVAWSNLASAQFLLGERAYETGKDPRPRLKEAGESCLKSAGLNPKYAAAINNLSNVRQLEGDYLANVRHEDPLPAYGMAREAMARARGIKPDSFRYVQSTAEVELRCAAYMLRSGKNAGPFLDKAGPDAKKACELNPKNPDVWSTLAAYHLLCARWLAASGKPAGADIAAGLKAADAGLALNRDFPATLGHKAFLVALKVQGEKDPARRSEGIKEAQALAAQARAAHPDAATRLELDECEGLVRQQGDGETENR